MLQVQYRSRASSPIPASRMRVARERLRVSTVRVPRTILSIARVRTLRVYSGWLARRRSLQCTMTRLSKETRSRVVLLKSKGFKIEKRLSDDEVVVSRRTLFKLFAKHRRTGSVGDLPRATIPRLLSKQQYSFIDDCMAENDELTARQMRRLLSVYSIIRTINFSLNSLIVINQPLAQECTLLYVSLQ